MKTRLPILSLFCATVLLQSSALLAQVPTLDPSQTVNPANGSMGFALPLATIQGVNGHSFPLTLNYAAGIQYHQQSSPLGLGFSYGVGGISRKPVYVPDDNRSGDYVISGNVECDLPPRVYIVENTIIIVSALVTTVVSALTGQAELPFLAALVINGAVGAFVSVAQPVASQLLLPGPGTLRAGGSHQPQYNYTSGHGIGFLQKDYTGWDYDLPDIYFVSTPYISGVIVWDYTTNRFILQQTNGSSSDNTKIEYGTDSNGYITSFTITTADGTVLIFNQTQKVARQNEYFASSYSSSGSHCWTDSPINQKPIAFDWFLTEVRFNDYINNQSGSWIRFEYSSIEQTGVLPLVKTYQATFEGLSDDGFYPNQSDNDLYFNEVYLNRIVTPNQAAMFHYEMDRKDDVWFEKSKIISGGFLPNGKVAADLWKPTEGNIIIPPIERPRLNEIELTGLDGQIAMKIEFTQDYSLAQRSINSVSKLTDGRYNAILGNQLAGRLTLKQIAFTNALGEKLPPISFGYSYNPNAEGQTVPIQASEFVPRCSYPNGPVHPSYFQEEKDIWGYYCPSVNGRTSNDFNSTSVWSRVCDANGLPYASSWSMTRANFPNGCAIRWEYEPNRYDMVNNLRVTSGSGQPKYGSGIRVKKITFLDGVTTNVHTLSYFYTCDKGVFADNTNTTADTCNSSGHVTVEPNDYSQENDYRTKDGMKGGLYTPSMLMYEKVQVVNNHQPDATIKAPQGYTVNEFVTPREFPNQGRYGDYDESWRRGMLKKVSIYNSNNRQVAGKELWYDYQVVGKMSQPTDPKQYYASAGTVRLVKTTGNADGVNKISEDKYAQDLSGEPDAVQFPNYVKSYGLFTEQFVDDPATPNMRNDNYFLYSTMMFGDKAKDDLVIIHCRQFTLKIDPVWQDGIALYFRVIPDFMLTNGIIDTMNITTEKQICNPASITDFQYPIGFSVFDSDGDNNPEIRYTIRLVNGTSIENVLQDVVINGKNISYTETNVETPIGAPNPTNTCAIGADQLVLLDNFGSTDNYLITQKGNATFDRDGMANVTINYGNDKIVYTKRIPAFTQYSVMEMKHMYSQSCQTIVYDGAVDAAHAVGSQVTTWSLHFGDDGISMVYLPDSTYSWKQNLNGDGLSPPGVSLPEFPFSNLSQINSSIWQYAGGIRRRDKYNHIIESATPVGVGRRMSSTTVYGHGGILPIAGLQNASFKEAGAYTCDYDLDQVIGTSNYVDSENGWLKAYATVTSGPNREKHFGEYCVKIEDGWGLGRNNKVNPDKEYLFSAWVKVDQGATLRLCADYYFLGIDVPEDWPLPKTSLESNPYDANHLTVTHNQAPNWKYVELRVHVKDKVKQKGSRTTYVRSFIDVQGGAAYMDDIRFYPTDAMVSTTYYDTLFQQPITTVGNDNKPSQKVNFDGFGRPVKWEKYKPLTGEWRKTTEKKYYLMNELLPGEHIRLLSPNGGEKFSIHDHTNITWVNDESRTIKLFYRQNSGSWTELATIPAAENTGMWYWSDITPACKDVTLRVMDADATSIVDEAEASFIINTPPPQAQSLLAAQQFPPSYSVNFSWACDPDADGDVVKYTLYIDEINFVAKNLTNKQFTKVFNASDIGKTFTWRIVSDDGIHQTRSADGTFTIIHF